MCTYVIYFTKCVTVFETKKVKLILAIFAIDRAYTVRLFDFFFVFIKYCKKFDADLLVIYDKSPRFVIGYQLTVDVTDVKTFVSVKSHFQSVYVRVDTVIEKNTPPPHIVPWVLRN